MGPEDRDWVTLAYIDLTHKHKSAQSRILNLLQLCPGSYQHLAYSFLTFSHVSVVCSGITVTFMIK